MRRTAQAIGRFGEEVVAKFFGYDRVPASGARWPNKQDLVRERALAPLTYPPVGGKPARDKRVVTEKELAQVKTTASRKVLQEWKDLERHAAVEGAEPVWYEVVVGPEEVLVFERRLVRRLTRGIGGEVEG